jgi:F-type H+-transporting ATPase subunit epsilon
MSNTLNLDIITPDDKVFDGDVLSVIVPGTKGSFQVKYNHAPIISTLSKGPIQVETEAGMRVFNALEDGVIEVLNNQIIILCEKIAQD